MVVAGRSNSPQGIAKFTGRLYEFVDVNGDVVKEVIHEKVEAS